MAVARVGDDTAHASPTAVQAPHPRIRQLVVGGSTVWTSYTPKY